MRQECPSCGTRLSINDDKIPAAGKTVRCRECGFRMLFKPAGARASKSKARSASPGSGSAKASKVKRAKAASAAKASAAAHSRSVEVDVAVAKDSQKGAGPSFAERLFYPGPCRSAARFRFRDLFWALKAPLDARKTLCSAIGVFVGSALLISLGWLGGLVGSGVGFVIGHTLGALLFSACVFLGLGAATRQADREMIAGRRLPLAAGLDFIKTRTTTVVGFPFLFVAGIAALGAGIAVFHLIARVPYAGPILYGLTSAIPLGLAMAAVLLFALLVFFSFSYISAAGELGPVELGKHLWRLLRAHPGGYALHLLVATATSVVLFVVLGALIDWALWLIVQVDRLVGGGQYAQIRLSTPGGLFALWELLFGSGLGAGKGHGWQFALAGWLMFVVLLAFFSLIVGFVLTYHCAAGAVNYHLLTQKKRKAG